MPQNFSWPLEAPPASPTATPSASVQTPPRPKREKQGAQFPFALGPRDVATTTGDDLLADRASLVLGQEGGFPWRPEMVVGFDKLRNQRVEIQRAFAQVYAADALQRWIPNLSLASVVGSSAGRTTTLAINVRRNDTRGATAPKTLPVQVQIQRIA